MNYAVSFYKNDTTGIPDGWPKLIRPLGKSVGPLDVGEELKTDIELDAIKASLAAAMKAHDDAEVAATQTATRTRADLIEAARKDLKLALDNWDTLTASQLKLAQKRVTQLVYQMLADEVFL